MAEEKRQQQRADVAAIHVRVGHEDNFMVAQLAGIEIVLADTGTERGDDGANFFVAQHLVVTRFFDVKDFALERQDRLIFAVAAHLRRAPGRFALDNEQLAPRGIALLTIREFPRQATRVHCGLAACQFACFAGGFAGARRFDAFADDAPRHG